MNARDIAVAAVALTLGCLGPTAALVAGMQGTCGAAPIVVGGPDCSSLRWEAPASSFAVMMRTRSWGPKVSLNSGFTGVCCVLRIAVFRRTNAWELTA